MRAGDTIDVFVKYTEYTDQDIEERAKWLDDVDDEEEEF